MRTPIKEGFRRSGQKDEEDKTIFVRRRLLHPGGMRLVRLWGDGGCT
ncbi:hypothetical protein SD77_1738 [Bacillus badius]|uniref:Uncharacterized protein n=1 Tax=Bacillus badius TaxID=1455 RepID=A0ABR5ASI0_BACBA|nr:hypothetical protein SD77_1738 [Bacillus badius]